MQAKLPSASVSVKDEIWSVSPNRDMQFEGPLLFTGFLCIAAHDLDLLRLDIVLIIELEVDVFDKKCPNFVTEAVCVQVTLHPRTLATIPSQMRLAPLP